ncbi:MAG: hydrogenase maturation protease [Planctomycetota bacterium]
MTVQVPRMLVIGYGNPGRLDDGLGPALATAIEKLALPGVRVECNYQLTVEDAAAIAKHDIVIFADAAVSGSAPFFLQRVQPSGEMGFSTHSVEPAELMALVKKLFGADAQGYALGLRGYSFNEFGERLSEQAKFNLTAAVEYLVQALRKGTFSEVGSGPDTAHANGHAGSNGDRKCKKANT